MPFSTKFSKRKDTIEYIEQFYIQKKYFYFSLDQTECITCLEILARLPDRLNHLFKCINVNEYEVTGIEKIPALDDGISNTPFQGLEAILKWLLDQLSVLIPFESEQWLKYQNKKKIYGFLQNFQQDPLEMNLYYAIQNRLSENILPVYSRQPISSIEPVQQEKEIISISQQPTIISVTPERIAQKNKIQEGLQRLQALRNRSPEHSNVEKDNSE